MKELRVSLAFGVACLWASLCGCASTQERGLSHDEGEDYSKHLGEVFAQQATCWNAWGSILDDWKSNGGGLKGSMLATRAQITNDDSSVLAKLVRDARSRQSPLSQDAAFGSWPISVDAYRSVIFSIDGEHQVPKECEAPIWLDGWFWDDLRFVDGDPLKVRRLSDMPLSIDGDDPHDTTNWIFYWLFVRID